MISIKELLYKLDLKLNNLATNQNQFVPDEHKLLVLNEAQIKLIKKKINPNNIYGLGYDAFTKRYEDLQNFAVPFEKVKVTESNKVYQTFIIDLSKLEQKYMFATSIVAMCSKDECKDRPIVVTRVVKHMDIDTWMKNTAYNPSFEYQETLATISDNKIYIYTDKTFKVDYAYISYLRYPKEVGLDGVYDLEGNLYTTQDSEFVPFLQDELLDLAVLELGINTNNIGAVQASDIRIKNNE